MGESRNLLASPDMQIGRARAGRGSHRNRAGTILPKGQEARETVVAPNTQGPCLGSGQPPFRHKVVEERMQSGE